MSQRINWTIDGTKFWQMNSGSGARTEYTGSANALSLDSDPYNATTGITGDGWSYVWSFPASIRIDKVYFRGQTGAKTLTLKTSNDSTNGYDNSWTTVATFAYPGSWTASNIVISNPQPALWFRIDQTHNTYNIFSIHFYGEYINPRFEFWHPTNNVEFTDDYPLIMPTIPNYEDSGNLIQQFRIFNADTVAHSYSGYLEAVKYGGDAVMTDHITISPNTISNLAGETASSIISVTANYPVAHNPADGYHYFKVKVVEVS